MFALGRKSHRAVPRHSVSARLWLPLIAVATALALVLAGCGSSSHHKKASGTTAAQTATRTTGHTTSTKAKAAKPPTTKKSTATKTGSGGAHGSGGAATTSPPPAGLRATGGYGMYELCSGHCTGSVPAALERPLHLPSAPPGGGCRASAERGPVRPQRSPDVKLESFIGSSWKGAEVTWESAASYHGPVLIRGRELGGTGTVGFGEGHDPYDQLQLLDAAQGMPRGPTRKWPSFTRVHGAGCYAYQVDGTNFSDVIVFGAS